MEKTNTIFNKGEVVENKYEIQFLIQSYTTAQVYRVKDSNGKFFRLKVFNSAKLKREHFHSNGELLEINILKSLDHPNIINLKDFGDFNYKLNRYYFLATEFISGESLQERLKRENPLSVYAAIPIVIELLHALYYLHKHSDPIIYNGLTLNNVFLDYKEKREKVFLTNFHNARYFNSEMKGFESEDLQPFFMAPETFNNIFTPSTDLFSVGALLYNLVTGIPPWYVEFSYQQVNKKEITDKIFEARKKPLKISKNDEFIMDNDIINIIKKSLELDVEKRFDSSNEFIKALKREIVVETYDSTNEKKSGLSKKNQVKPDNNKIKGFQLIAGMDELKNILYNDVIRALNEPELYKRYGITIPNGMLLYGPPGCGKTYFAQRFAEEVGYNFILVKPSDIQSKYINATQENITKLFNEAEGNSPTIIFFDELDALVPSRELELHQMLASAVNELLVQMTNCGERGIFVIAATNRPDKIDAAMLRTGRIDKIFYIPPPDKKAREEIFKIYLKERPIDINLNYSELSKLTENYVSSDIKFIVDEASRIALIGKTRISEDILFNLINQTKPSVSLKEITRYKNMQSNLQDNINDEIHKRKSTFGFTLPDEKNDKE